MDEQKVHEIFVKHLSDKSLDDALVAARKEAIDELLANIFSEGRIGEKKQALILKLSDALGRLGYFILTPITITAGETKHFKNLVFIYQTAEELFAYTLTNYNGIDSKRFKEQNPHSELKKNFDQVLENTNQKMMEFATRGSVSTEPNQHTLLAIILERILQYVLLEEKASVSFIQDAEKIISILTKYKMEMSQSTGNKVN